jgi:hypothetical protein
MCPACASAGMIAIAGVVSTAALTGVLVKLRGCSNEIANDNINQ